MRITAPSLGWEGQTTDVVALHGDTLLLRRTDLLAHIPPLSYFLSPTRVPLSAVASLEVSRNHGAHSLALLIGSTGGGFAGIAIGLGLNDCQPSSGLDFHCLGSKMLSALLGAAIGGGLGGLLGGAIVPERWTPIGLPGTRASLVPLPGGRLGLGLSLALSGEAASRRRPRRGIRRGLLSLRAQVA